MYKNLHSYIQKNLHFYIDINSNTETLKYLKKQLKKKDDEIANLLQVLESGKISELIINRIEEKRKEKEEIKKRIAIEEMKTPNLTVEKVKKFLEHFRSGDYNDIKYRKSLINVFVNKVIVYEDKLTILYNLQDSQSNVLYNTTMVNYSKLNTKQFYFVSGFGINIKL